MYNYPARVKFGRCSSGPTTDCDVDENSDGIDDAIESTKADKTPSAPLTLTNQASTTSSNDVPIDTKKIKKQPTMLSRELNSQDKILKLRDIARAHSSVPRPSSPLKHPPTSIPNTIQSQQDSCEFTTTQLPKVANIYASALNYSRPYPGDIDNPNASAANIKEVKKRRRASVLASSRSDEHKVKSKPLPSLKSGTRRCTAGAYEQKKHAFSKEHWISIGSLYNDSSVEFSFPSWNELPKGIDPKYQEVLEGQQFVASTLRSRSEVLMVDSIGFEAEVRRWIKKISNVAFEVLQENLQNPSEFTRFSTKSKTRKIDIQLDPSNPEIIVTSQRTGKITRIPFSQVNEIRIGAKTKGFETWRSEVIDESRAFTIVYGDDKELNLMTKYEHKIQLWLGGLIQIIPLYKGDNTEFAYLSEHWRTAGKKSLPIKGIKSLLERMKIKIATKQVKEILEQQKILHAHDDVPAGEYLLEDYIALIKSLRISTTVIEIFTKFSKNGKLTDKKLLRFLHTEQNEVSIRKEDLQEMLESFRDKVEDNFLTLDGFGKFMESEHARAFNPFMNNIYQTMDRPLTDYFIYSSHNTYLEGNQLSGWSSSDMYIRVLKAGCRCVELDCWNGDNGEPIIFHGHTLTTRILFEDAIRAIRDYAFVSSDFPVILSLENHCNVAQQTRMAEIMLQYLKDNIARPIANSDKKYLPSPKELKGKILIKGKVDKVNLNAGYSESEPEIKVKVSPELAAITYLHSTSFTNFEQFAQQSKGCWEICSFVETKIEGLGLTDFIEFNKRNFSRIYPKGSRTMSSNYNPEPFWSGGSQLVALNLQTMGKISWTNEGKFKDNGGCGYVLKPFYMLHDFPDRFDENSFVPVNPIKLSIEIIGARQLPRSKVQKADAINVYVSVSVRGCKLDTRTQITGKVRGNAFNPCWNKRMSFNVMFPENAVLLFTIYNEVDTLKGFLKGLTETTTKIAYYSLPISCIRQGYRIMDLYAEDGSKSPMSDLFCKFSIRNIESKNTELMRRRDSFSSLQQ